MISGRPSKLTPKLHEEVVTAIRHGCYVETAVEMAGINKTTFYQWVKAGTMIENEEKPCITAHDEAMRDFSNAIKIATAQAEFRDISVIDSAAQSGQWQAAAWKLERKHHAKWGRKVAVTDEQGGNFFEGMAKAWANALENDDGTTIEGEIIRPRLNGNTNGSNS